MKANKGTNKGCELLQCTAWREDGKGMAMLRGQSLPVAGFIPGETAEVRIKHGVKGTFVEGYVDRLATSSPLRVKPNCLHYGACGACQLQHLSAEGQRVFKQEVAERYLGRFGKVNPIVQMPEPWRYRNKSHITFSEPRRGVVQAGLYQEGTHRVTAIESCLVQPVVVDEITKTMLALMKSFKFEPFNEDRGSGLIRHILVRQGFATGKIMVVVVVSTLKLPSKRNFLQALLKAHPEITTVLLNQNNQRTSMILGPQFEKLYGLGYIREKTGGLSFEISPSSFYQINPFQTERLYKIALDFAELTKDDVVCDAYCGVGTIGLLAAKFAKEVVGVENNRESIIAAERGAAVNQVKNIRFICSDAGQWMRQYASAEKVLDVLIMDPPRAGADNGFLDSVVKLKPKRIVYISCNMETQQRDLQFLCDNQYIVTKIQPLDMFPQTSHIESVCQLQLK